MSDQMRDARLKKALDSAPDAAERPGDAVREAILHKAKLTAAAATAAGAPPRSSSSRPWFRPWNSALATLGAVALVGVLWWQQGDLLTEPPQEAVPAAVPAPVPMAEAPRLETPTPAAKSEASQRRSAEKAAAARPQREEHAHKRAADRADMADMADAASLERKERLAEGVLAPSPPSPPPPPVVAMAPPAPAVAATPPAPMFAPSASLARASAAAELRLAARAAASEPLQQSVAIMGSAIARSWTALRSGAVVLPRAQLPAATQLLLAQLLPDEAAAANEVFGEEAIDLRVELMLGERVYGLLELSPTALRWTPTGQPARVAKPAQLSELRARLLAALSASPPSKE